MSGLEVLSLLRPHGVVVLIVVRQQFAATTVERTASGAPNRAADTAWRVYRVIARTGRGLGFEKATDPGAGRELGDTLTRAGSIEIPLAMFLLFRQEVLACHPVQKDEDEREAHINQRVVSQPKRDGVDKKRH